MDARVELYLRPLRSICVIIDKDLIDYWLYIERAFLVNWSYYMLFNSERDTCNDKEYI